MVYMYMYSTHGTCISVNEESSRLDLKQTGHLKYIIKFLRTSLFCLCCVDYLLYILKSSLRKHSEMVLMCTHNLCFGTKK